MTYTVGDRIDLSYLNTPQQNERRASLARVKRLPGKFIPGARISFMKMAQGLIVMAVDEPEMPLTVSFG